MKALFLLFTFTLLLVACGKPNNSSGEPVCHRRQYEVSNCLRQYTRVYGHNYTQEMCNRYGQTVTCN